MEARYVNGIGTSALYATALESGLRRVRGRAASRYFALDNVVLTPHVARATREAFERLIQMVKRPPS